MVKESYLYLLLNIIYQSFIAIVQQNYKFLETKICFMKKKMFNIFLGLCIYFIQKSVKMILENHSLNHFWTAYYILCHLVYIIPSLISMT